MLYKFKSSITADVIMLEPNGRQVLRIIGKPVDGPDAGKGILEPSAMAAAMAALELAMAQEDAQRAQARQEGQAMGGETVSLRQRAVPLLDMMRRCQAAEKDIVWGV